MLKKSKNVIASNSITINPEDFKYMMNKITRFFISRGFAETYPSPNSSILSTYCKFEGIIPTHGYVWLENELLDNPDRNGYFSIRNHYIVSPGKQNYYTFDFESKGTMSDMIQLNRHLLAYLGFTTSNIPRRSNYYNDSYFRGKVAESLVNDSLYYSETEYDDISIQTNCPGQTDKLDPRIRKEYNSVCFIKNFPKESNSLWNIKEMNNKTKRVDIILNGINTITGYEKSCNPEEIKHNFYEQNHVDILYNTFSKQKVDKDFDEYISKTLFPRYGGRIIMSNIADAMVIDELLPSA